MPETNLMRMMMISRIEELWPYYSKNRLDPNCSRWRNIEVDGVHVSALNLHTVPEPVLVRIFEMFIRRCQTMM